MNPRNNYIVFAGVPNVDEHLMPLRVSTATSLEGLSEEEVNEAFTELLNEAEATSTHRVYLVLDLNSKVDHTEKYEEANKAFHRDCDKYKVANAFLKLPLDTQKEVLDMVLADLYGRLRNK